MTGSWGEGIDQTLRWLFTLHILAVLLFNEVVFKEVLVNNPVLDKRGRKMPKRLGNSVDPFAAMVHEQKDQSKVSSK